jgi:hypothetical protein
MGTGRILCRKCHAGVYDYSDTDEDREDWWNRKMKCNNCGLEETLAENCEQVFGIKQE